jgi:hypothetical protein
MFALPLPTAVVAFTPSVLPDFYAIPAPIPNHPPSAQLPLRSLSHTRSAETSTDQELWWLPGLFSVIMYCSVPSATPGEGALARLAGVGSLFSACDAWPFLPFQVSVSIEQHFRFPSPAATAPVACVNRQSFGLPNVFLSGLTTGFSSYRFTSQPFRLRQLLPLNLDTGG